MASERSATLGGSTFASTLARRLLPSQDHGKNEPTLGASEAVLALPLHCCQTCCCQTCAR